MAEPQPQPVVCVFLKLPPSYRQVSRIHEIAWNAFLSQLNRLNHAFEAAQVTHPSSEAKKIWSDARQGAAEMMSTLQDVMFTNYNTAFDFLSFLDALRRGRGSSEPYQSFCASTREAFKKAGIAQEGMLEFREAMRIVVGRLTTVISGDDKDVSSFTTESGQIMLELATAVEECNAMLEEYRDEIKEVQRQSFDEKDTPPSEVESQMVQEKWQVFLETAERLKDRWEVLKDQIRGSKSTGEPAMASDTPTNPTMPPDPLKSPKIPFWRKFFQRISSCLSLERFR